MGAPRRQWDSVFMCVVSVWVMTAAPGNYKDSRKWPGYWGQTFYTNTDHTGGGLRWHQHSFKHYVYFYIKSVNLWEFGQLTTGHDDGHKEAAKKWVSCANSRKWLFWLSIKMSASVLNEWAAMSRGGWALNPRRRRGWGTRPLNEAIIAKTGASLEIIPEKVPKNIASSCLVAPSWRSYQVFSGAEPLVDIEIKPETYFRF